MWSCTCRQFRYGRCVASRFGAVTISKEVHALVPWNTSNSTSEWSARLVPRVQDPYVAEDPWQFRVSAASKGSYHAIPWNAIKTYVEEDPLQLRSKQGPPCALAVLHPRLMRALSEVPACCCTSKALQMRAELLWVRLVGVGWH